MFRRSKFVFDDEAKQAFLERVEETGLVAKAAKAVGTISRVVLEELKYDEEFAAAYEEAMLLYNDRIIEEIHRRAIEGIDEPVYYKGELIDHKRSYSDQLLQFHAKANIEKYQDKSKQEVNITGGVLVAPAPAATAEAWLEAHSPKAQLPAAPRDEVEDTDERIIDVGSGDLVPA